MFTRRCVVPLIGSDQSIDSLRRGAGKAAPWSPGRQPVMLRRWRFPLGTRQPGGDRT